MNRYCFLLLLLAGSLPLTAREGEGVPRRVYTTVPLGEASAPRIDGQIDDDCWNKVEWSGGYVEWSPEENTAPAEETSLKILYDNRNLYVAFRCFDRDPSGVVRRLSRRDGFDGDWVEINIDSYHDLRTAFSFTITAAGVKGEEFITDNGANWDATWNPIWYARTRVDEQGWTAEIRIPLSQLRFGKDPDQIWGIQSTRRYFRSEERSVWQRSPQNAAGWVSGFGELRGLLNLKPQKQIAFKPYLVSDLNSYPAESGNPFRDGRDGRLDIGLDGKIGISNDLTLDFTVNPDFGQVEADPSAIALDGFQIFFQEQRPFFIENKNIFDYKFATSLAGNTFGFDNLFYSRRIGRSPQGFPQTGAQEFSEQPDVTTILGAAKLSGKTRNGWSIGILESVTAKENAVIATADGNRKESVEPLSNYFVGRLQRDFNQRNTWLGGIVTATNRSLKGNSGLLHRSAYSGGLDVKHQWHNRAWYLGGNLVFSRVAGSAAAITRTQRSISHLFQRSDATYLEVDTSKTALGGHGGNVQIGKAAGNWRFESGATWHTPGLELNDLGFQRQADDLRHYSWAGYRTTKPLAKIRQFTLNYTHLAALDFGGNLNQIALDLNGWVHLKNNWWINGGINYKPLQYSNYLLRGGPRMRLAGEFSYRNGIISDSRRKLRLTLNHSAAWGSNNAGQSYSASAALTCQPTNALQMSLSPGYDYNRDPLQFVSTGSINNNARYIMAEIDQRTFSIPLRVDYIIKPDLSLQYWGQPFISRGRYSSFKRISNPTAAQFSERFVEYRAEQLQLNNGSYSVDEDVNGSTDYSFAQPDFAFIQWRSNLVLRWEYFPGSELFLVWSQDISQPGDFTGGLYQELDKTIRGTQPSNIFLLKATWQLMN